MEVSSFWLIDITDSTVSVSLIATEAGRARVSGLGNPIVWSETDESLLMATDQSLSATALNVQLPESAEPSVAAFILPPFWIDADGKITPTKLKLIETVCKSLNLKPMGFVPNDEAVVEDASTTGDLPPSFILLNLGSHDFFLSLAYLGKIQSRIVHRFEGEFSANFVESALLELNSTSTLPPQIIIFGQINDAVKDSLRNYPWTGKKDIETFLHFPEIVSYTHDVLTSKFAKVIFSQLNFPSQTTKPVAPANEEPEEATDSVVAAEQNTSQELPTAPNITEVTPESLGFTSVVEAADDQIVAPTSPPEPSHLVNPAASQLFVQNNEPPVAVVDLPVPQPVAPKDTKKVSIKPIHITFPKIKFKTTNLLYFISIFPLLILIPFYFTHANVTIFVSPYEFSKTVNVTLDSSINEINTQKAAIPVEKKSFDLTASSSLVTTGQKVIGNNARGSIAIFNKSDKLQKIPKGTIVVDAGGKKYELDNTVEVASSSSNFDEGVITLGQAKAQVTASDIGQEYNLAANSSLSFKDIPTSTLVAKVKDAISGGSKSQIQAVSAEDKKKLDDKVTQIMGDVSQANVSQKLNAITGAIKQTLSVRKNRVEFNREVGEQADELTATAQSTVTVFALNPSLKNKIITSFLSSDPNYTISDIKTEDFNLDYKIDKITSSQATGQITITGKSMPKIDVAKIQSTLAGKSYSWATNYLKKDISRVYNYNIKTTFEFIKNINPLPFIKSHITIDIKT
jgi:hypothetical protein